MATDPVSRELAAVPAGEPRKRALALSLTLLAGASQAVYVARYASAVPLSDDWVNMPQALGRVPVTLAWLWQPIAEHRLPLSRLVFARVSRLFGGDMRAVMLLDVVLLTAAAWLLVLVARRWRGRSSWADGLIPLFLLSPGQHQNLLWGMGVPFMLPVFLFAVTLAGLTGASWAGGAAAALALLPASDASGTLLALPLTVLAIHTAFRGSPARARSRATALLLASAVCLAFVVAQIATASRPTSYPLTRVRETLRAVLELGSVIVKPRPSPHLLIGAAILGAVALAAFAARRAPRGPHTLSMAAALASAFLVVAAIASARGGFGPGQATKSEYVTLVMPLACVAVMLASQPESGWQRRVALSVLVVGFFAYLPATCRQAVEFGRARRAFDTALTKDVERGLPLEALVARYGMAIYDDDTRVVPEKMRLLESARLGPFAGGARLQPYTEPLSATPAPLDAVRTHEMTWADRQGNGTSTDPYAVFALPRPTDVVALRLRVRLKTASGEPGWLQVFWAAENEEFRQGLMAPFWIPGDGSLQELTVWTFQSVAAWRLDPVSSPVAFHVVVDGADVLRAGGALPS